MTSVLLVSVLLGILVFGYFLMGRLDNFLNENRKALEQNGRQQEPSRILLTDEMTDEELAREISDFRSRHAHMRLILYDAAEETEQDFPEKK